MLNDTGSTSTNTGLAPSRQNDFRGRGKSKGRDEHSVTRPDTRRHKHDLQRVGTVGDSDRLARVAKLGQASFEFKHLRTHDKLAMVKHASDPRVDLPA